MYRSALIVMALATAPLAYGDEVTDVRLLAGDQQLWIALDGQPTSIDVRSDIGAIILSLNGFTADFPRAILPPTSDAVSGISVTPGAEATEIRIEGAFAGADAQLRQGGILVDLSGGTYQPAIAAAQPASGDYSRPIIEDGQSSFVPSYGDDEPMAFDASAHDNQRSTTPSFQIGPSRQAEVEQSALEATSEPGTASVNQPSRLTDPVETLSDEPAVEVDLSSVPGEIELVEEESLEPGPCDPTASAVASSPWDLDALASHAACLVEIGETVNGAGLYERVLAFEPGHFQAALGLARLREQQGRRGDAARLFDTAADAALTDGQALAARQAARRLRDAP